jgi:CRISPR-associated protein Csb2
VALVERVRNAAAHKLSNAMNDHAATIERVIIGRNATDADKDQRLRILPLPSIGHHHTSRAIRRILVEIPPDCPLASDDIDWAFSGLEPHDAATGELAGWSLVPAEDRRMLGHYGIEGDRRGAFHLWRTVTPAALPERAARRRIDPRRIADEAKGAAERTGEEARAATAVLHTLRHARVTTQVESVRVQREPFEAKGARAEAFAPGTRFAKERLWHVDIRFAAPHSGPLVIGDGRYLGLGLMAPVKDAWRDVTVLALPREANVTVADAAELLRAVRRALMALSRDSKGAVPRLFSGHEPDGAPTSSGGHEHVFLAADDADRDGYIERLIVAAPWVCDRSGHAPRQSDRALFDRVVSSFNEVRAGKLGVIALGLPPTLAADDPIFGPARTWESRAVYRPTRHASRGKDPAAAVVQDVITECERRGLPRPEAELLELNAGPNGGGISARLRLRFAVAVEGPIMLGCDSHRGGGLFAAVDERSHAH